MLKKGKVGAFTLLEALVALLVISGAALFEIQYQEQTKAKEWLLFADQLDAELSRSHFEKVEQNKLYVKQDGKSIAVGKSKSDDFRKTDANGRGDQPMIYGLEAAQIHKEGQIVHLHLQFKDGLEREYIYRVEEEH